MQKKEIHRNGHDGQDDGFYDRQDEPGRQGGGMMSRMMGMRGSHKPGASEHNEAPAMPGMSCYGHEHGMQMMPHMMTEMMPHCLEMMLPNMPKENRADFMAKMVAVLMEQGTAGMSEEEKSECIGKIVEQVTTAGALAR